MLLAADADTEVEGDGKTMALLQAKISAKISAKWYQILHQERHCAIIEDLLAAEAKDAHFPLVNDDFLAQIDTNGSAPYGEHCKEWTSLLWLSRATGCVLAT